jgi:hypothetical protein
MDGDAFTSPCVASCVELTTTVSSYLTFTASFQLKPLTLRLVDLDRTGASPSMTAVVPDLGEWHENVCQT